MSETGLSHYREALNAQLMSALHQLTADIGAVAQRQQEQARKLEEVAGGLAQLRNAVSNADSTALSMTDARITAARQAIERQVAEGLGHQRAELAELRAVQAGLVARVGAIEEAGRLRPWLVALLTLIAVAVLLLVGVQLWAALR